MTLGIAGAIQIDGSSGVGSRNFAEGREKDEGEIQVSESEIRVAIEDALDVCEFALQREGFDVDDECPTPNDLCGDHVCHEIGCILDKYRRIKDVSKQTARG